MVRAAAGWIRSELGKFERPNPVRGACGGPCRDTRGPRTDTDCALTQVCRQAVMEATSQSTRLTRGVDMARAATIKQRLLDQLCVPTSDFGNWIARHDVVLDEERHAQPPASWALTTGQAPATGGSRHVPQTLSR